MLEQASEIKQAVVQLLARREHSRQELRNKLRSRCESESLLEQVIDECEQLGYQSDRRTGEMLLRARANQGYGLMRIRQDARQKGLDNELVNSLLEELDLDWFELAKECYLRKYSQPLDGDYKLRAKRMRFLSGRGFSIDQINYAMAPSED